MKGILSFEMIRAGTDVLIDAGVPEHVTQAAFEAIHSVATPDIVGKQTEPKRYEAGLTSSSPLPR